MATVTFDSRLTEDGTLLMPREAVIELGLLPGDDVRARVEVTRGRVEEPDQAALMEKFERFFEYLDTLTFEPTASFDNDDPVKATVRAAMDEKFKKLGLM